MFTVVSWKVNCLRTRLEQVLRYVDAHEPDVVCLQETRVADPAFPLAPFHARGYTVTTASPRSDAGVALASRRSIDEQVVGIPGYYEAGDPGRRLACRFGSLWIDTIYAPAQERTAKVNFLKALREDHDRRLGPAQELIVAGDFSLLTTAGLAGRLVEFVHDLEPRSWARPSGHAPLRASFKV